MDGQPPCTCQCHPKYGNPFDECCKTGHPIDGSLGAVPFDAEGGDSPLDELFRFADELRDGDVYRIPIVGESIIPALPRVHAPYPSQVTAAARERGLARLRFAIAWCGPWERLEARFLAIDTGTLDLRRIIRDGTWRERLAAWCGSRDLEWQRRHVETGTTPNRRWRRKAGH